jgi:hypothetical protein
MGFDDVPDEDNVKGGVEGAECRLLLEYALWMIIPF